MTELLTDETLVATCEACKATHVLHVRIPVGLTVYWTAAYCETCCSFQSHRWHRPAVNDHECEEPG
jgi:hypothetical protein